MLGAALTGLRLLALLAHPYAHGPRASHARRGHAERTFRCPEHCDLRDCLIGPSQAIKGGASAAARRALGMLPRVGEVERRRTKVFGRTTIGTERKGGTEFECI